MNRDRKEARQSQSLFPARPKKSRTAVCKLIEEIAAVCEPDHKTARTAASVELPHALWFAEPRMFGGQFRPYVLFGAEDFRHRRRPSGPVIVLEQRAPLTVGEGQSLSLRNVGQQRGAHQRR